MSYSTEAFEVNGRRYQPPDRPVAVLCVDGSADEYLDAAMVRGRMPHLSRLVVDGHRGFARAALPTFTNVNNVSIVTGVPPSIHGVCGNYFLNPETGEEIMMNSPEFLRAPTLLAGAASAGRRVAMITAKDKLRLLLSEGLDGIAFSAEKAGEAVVGADPGQPVETIVGEPTPPIYSGDASVYVLKAGNALLRDGLADFLYLSLTDYIQHLYAPEDDVALAFYEGMDREIGRLAEAGCVLGITADHGMNAKHDEAGNPRVLYLEEALNDEFGGGIRVILPITDPYVKHHGALGSFAVVHLQSQGIFKSVRQWLRTLPEVSEVYERDLAVEKLELPEDRIGELVVLAKRDAVLGRTPADHDLSQLDAPLRSHGGRYEEMVPFIVSQGLSPSYQHRLRGDVRNFDIFDFVTSGMSL